MDKRYLEPEIEVVSFLATDVILASPVQSDDDFTSNETGVPGGLIV